ncbi:hypothetical protein Pla175_17600 [Pirellulimonas nuda]|uniref:Uncharacterized protein n=1 Tax=Pirellulimonas nuda TaxID=2528009 RepID=A0A518DA70_9BACT|nr:hypothetical protein [Pirellulimonas nuda]QDU88384.1 hypothetical protein Pla175_17600 [Pirellulimonas nuda]
MNATTHQVHPFEAAGLGKAPFRYVGYSHEVGPQKVTTYAPNGEEIELIVGAPGQPMSSCDYCGQGIAHVCHCVSSDGKEFKVGCDCVERVGQVKGDQRAQRAVEVAKYNLRRQREAKRRDEFARWIEQNGEELNNHPHPNAYSMSLGRTLRDYAVWMRKNGGHSGQMRAWKMARTKLGQ